jgi:hypothetical protein
MSKKYVVLKTSSKEKFNEIRPHLLKYNIECSLDFLDTNPIAVLKEHSELIKHDELTATVVSNLIVEQNEDSVWVTKRVYKSTAHGFLLYSAEEEDPKPWGWDAYFVPDGLMTSYYQLKKRGLKISPRDMNIGQFLQDFIHYNTNGWSFKELTVSRPVDLEVDYCKVLFDFFDIETQKDFIGYEFWKKIIESAVSGGLFIRASNTRKMNNYWWPVGNAGLPITSKPKDPMQEKTYMMHDIFHYLVPDLLYTGNTLGKNNYEWSYTLHRVMTECFTLVLGDMFYVHYLTINGLKYETVEKRRIYPIFEAIYGKRTDVFTNEILEEVVRASTIYGIHGYDAGFIALFVKYNGSYRLDEFRILLKNFRDKYDYYLIQDLKWTVHNASYMKEHSKKYEYLNGLEPITKRLEIVTLDSLELSEQKQDVNYFIDVGLKQLRKAMKRPIFPPNTILKNKFLRWALGQLCFFEHYAGIPIVDGNKEKFHYFVNEIFTTNLHLPVTLNKIKNFRYQWDYLMDRCVDTQIITLEEAKQYKEVFPIFDPHYISSYDDHSENHTEVMNNFLNTFEF